uniref:Uncharacterized protein n=1 Tax=Percolomonas cosmopolitus TaxID=63605 RepID=A0A7S1PFG9_9EUKA|mmetsp:Transcript_11206/g.41946  ORF Transcript_11206/g.41946 Transcript_11206/m.41946 type:complete len:590 (+) Transcript_11206:2280-4049(+)|eukprot:CAMPEP_0117446358 /NCGR_PEP_ID=MMETSP0759-20121206/6297_1 /TAXON_ID=63605 /ORGANISM="Percolomonas cosmopolitus, Strain WS" /LENGTH=589 /DNA_ID=CAMNT_0005238617 /DNA_START=2274 /DNA_END=4043 /DNA_ORIENTATION=-
MVSISQHNKSKKNSNNSSTASTSNKKKFGVVKRLQKQGGWTHEEDQLLLQAVKKFKERNWNKISESVPTRTATQCLHRFRKVLDPSISKSPWSDQEDQRLLDLVAEQETLSWSAISAQMPNRNAKQIRERYMNHLAPGIKKGVWDQKELDILVEAQKKLGNKWSKISQLVEGRSPNACKNQFHAYQQRLKKGIKPRKTKSTQNPPAPAKKVEKRSKKQNHKPASIKVKDATEKFVEDLVPERSASAQEVAMGKEGMVKTHSCESLNSMSADHMQDVQFHSGGQIYVTTNSSSDHMPISPDETAQPQMPFPQPQHTIFYVPEGAPIAWIAPSHMNNENSWVPMGVFHQPSQGSVPQQAWALSGQQNGHPITAHHYVSQKGTPNSAPHSPPVHFVHTSALVPSTATQYNAYQMMNPTQMQQISEQHQMAISYHNAAHGHMCTCGGAKPIMGVPPQQESSDFRQFLNARNMPPPSDQMKSGSPLSARVSTVQEDLQETRRTHASSFFQQSAQQSTPPPAAHPYSIAESSNLTPQDFSISPTPFGDSEILPYSFSSPAPNASRDFELRRVDPVEFTSSIPDEFVNGDEENFHF